MTLYIGSMFTAGMLKDVQEKPVTVRFTPAPLEKVKELVADGVTSGIGHPGTNQLIETLLDCGSFPVIDPANRPKLELTGEDRLIVFQYTGPRLAEGQVRLIVFQYTGPRLAEGQVLSTEECWEHHRQGHFQWLLAEIQGASGETQNSAQRETVGSR